MRPSPYGPDPGFPGRAGPGQNVSARPGPESQDPGRPGWAGTLWPPADGNNSIQTKNVQFNSSVNQRLKLPSGRHEPVRIVSQKTLHGTRVPGEWVPQKKAHAWTPESSKRTCPISWFQDSFRSVGATIFFSRRAEFCKELWAWLCFRFD